MVPHIPAIAVHDTFAATSPFEPASAIESTVPAGRAAFADTASSPDMLLVEQAEAHSRESQRYVDNELKRVLSGGRLQPADMLMLRNRININSETQMLFKKVSDSVVQGVQTLAKG
ncbi:MAG TPA: hypothetical protein VGN31_04340 [Paraburkholderia sp.]|jgi:hypothetical protein